MRVELLFTGDELVTGLVADTNGPWLEARLFERGLTVRRSQAVGDVAADITAALREAAARCDVLVVSGGLGPTADDLTLDCAAEAAGVPLEEDAALVAALRERFARRGLALTPNNLRMARVPRGAVAVPNPVGSAPMVVLELGACRTFLLPGVPSEFRALCEGEVLPRLQALREAHGPQRHRAWRLLRTVGLPESHLDARVAPLAARHPAVAFGFRTDAPENHLKLTAEGGTEAEARAALAAAEAEARSALGAFVYGADATTHPAAVVALLEAAGARVAAAESCTGGLVAAALTEVPGASHVFAGAAVAYTEAMKARWAGVPEGLLAAHGAVSREVAQALADGVRAACGADWGVSTTGWAGPGGGTEADPVGTVYLGLSGPAGVRAVERHVFGGDRARVRRAACAHALELLRRHLLGAGAAPG